MAQHMPIDAKYEGDTKEETQAIRSIVGEIKDDIRQLAVTEFQAKYERLPADYLEKGETEAYIKHINVPESLVWGGRATVEIHFRMSRSKIYLVA